jgi:hypothetical protein
MKTQREIVDILYQFVRGSSLHQEVMKNGGVIYTDDKRQANSGTEDITIFILDSLVGGDSQEFVANVNVYFKENRDGDLGFVNTTRERALSRISADVFEEFVASEYRFELSSQKIFKVDGANEYCINNKLIITHLR